MFYSRMCQKRGKKAPNIFEEIKESPCAHDLTDLEGGMTMISLGIDQLFCSIVAHFAVRGSFLYS